jgi:hypothetical protein
MYSFMPCSESLAFSRWLQYPPASPEEERLAVEVMQHLELRLLESLLLQYQEETHQNFLEAQEIQQPQEDHQGQQRQWHQQQLQHQH